MGIESYDYTVYYVYNESCEVIGFKYKYLDYANYPNWVTENYSYVKNLQGDIVGIVNDATGEQVVAYSYDSWGNITSITGSAASTIGQYNSMRYRGYYYDTDTGMYYLQSRYYNPVLRRFINADEYVNTGTGVRGCNMFAYCENNTVNGYDPEGTWDKNQHKTLNLIIGLNYSIAQWSYKADESPFCNTADYNAPFHAGKDPLNVIKSLYNAAIYLKKTSGSKKFQFYYGTSILRNVQYTYSLPN